MSLKKLIPAIVILIVLGAVILLLSSSDQQKIEKILAKGSNAVCEESVSKIMSLVSHDYQDTYGFTYQMLQRGFARTFFQIDSIQVRYTIRNITIKKNEATLVLAVTVTGSLTRARQFIIGEQDAPEQLTLSFTKGRFKWLISDSRWQKEQLLEEAFGIPSSPF